MSMSKFATFADYQASAQPIDHAAVLANITAMAAEVQRDKDAARYQFLRDQAYEAVVPHGGIINGSRTAWITKMHAGSTFDAAIDAAMGSREDNA